MADTKMSEKLWRDCKSDQERADFILCGRAHETGVIATSIQSEVAMAFQRLATLQSLTSINFTLPNHEPTIAIGEILDGYDGDDRDDVWESIKAYADVHARSALESTTPADAALAELADLKDRLKDPVSVITNMMRGIIAKPDFRAFLHIYGEVFNDLEACNIALAEANIELAALRARPQAVAEGFALVPVEPTGEMLAAGAYLAGQRNYEDSEIRNIYQDMLAASQSATGGAT